jgi:hypothetical protein
MQLFKYLLPMIAAMGFATYTPLSAEEHAHGHEGHGHSHEGHEHHGDDHHHGDGHDHFHGDNRGQDRSRYLEELNDRDWSALRDYLASKREEKEDEDDDGCGLTISGDVRTEYRHLNEKGINQFNKYKRLRGGNALKNGIPVSRNDFDIECNIRFDYKCDRTWAVAHLDFDNSAGVDDNERPCKCDPAGYHGSGSCDSVCLKKAYMGYNIYTCGDTRLDVELGRRNLYNVFDSQIQFLSRFDGLCFKFSDKLEYVADWYWNTAGFVVDERVNHFAWVTEVGFLDIADTGIDLKYSFIDWEKHGRNRCLNRNPRGFKFMVSQLTAAYHFDKEVFCGIPAKLYGAILRNHSNVRIKLPVLKKGDDTTCLAREEPVTFVRKKSQPIGWYVGFVVGEVRKEGDFAFSAQYEWVGATAMPDDDCSGIGNGNILNNSFTEFGRGNTNYKGMKFELLYGLTDNISLDFILESSRQIKKSIGGKHRYSKFELEAIYAF